eukprot:3232434-Ditylum_brightwellii.AAC.1
MMKGGELYGTGNRKLASRLEPQRKHQTGRVAHTGSSAVVTVEWMKGIGGRGTDSKWEDCHFPKGSDV